ncbi:hypothetical protein SPBR_04792 [Sporothrix brasiliensis 5110]|uniref:Uncharacterized protein n=1 Tax=Sporothrix brasiliensis 5110 TaxID=1398154 RepID=A0A0C2EMG6_9PEZI|nr:uncharacterized protein SPBR_04792 [Sporothrix brasiliensis 5110]KIH87279.1 hypothetical protein SPBR_04792 [Sporothrix brasiliensis 5110]
MDEIQTPILDRIRELISPFTFAELEHDFLFDVNDRQCFGKTKSLDGKRCYNLLQKTGDRYSKLMSSLSKLKQLAKAYEDSWDDNEGHGTFPVDKFCAHLVTCIDLQYCHLHKSKPIAAVEALQKRLHAFYQNRAQSKESDGDTDDDASSVKSAAGDDLRRLTETPTHSSTVTPNTTPQSRRVNKVTFPPKSTRGAEAHESGINHALEWVDDDDPAPPSTPTPSNRQRKYAATTSGSALSLDRAKRQTPQKGQKQQQQQETQRPQKEQLNEQPPVLDGPFIANERQEPQGESSVPAPNHSSPVVASPGEIEMLAEKVEAILTVSPSPLQQADSLPLHPDHMCCRSKDIRPENDEDCYIGTNYINIIRNMQTGYAHYKKCIGRIYVLRSAKRCGLFKIGFSERDDLMKRWEEVPCKTEAVIDGREPVFVSEAAFPGAIKVETLVKASLRHRQMSGHPTGAYDEFAHQLWCITPKRIHAMVDNTPPPLPQPRADAEATTPISATAPGAPPDNGSASGSGSGGRLTKETPPQPKPTPMVAAAKTVKRVVRKAMTWDSAKSSPSTMGWEEKGQGFTVVVEEVDELGDLDVTDGRRRSLRKTQRASQVASQVTSQIQSSISEIVNWRGRTSKRS